MLSTDLDDTLVGSHDGLLEFNELWKSQCAPRGCKLVYNTGRSLEDYRALLRDWPLQVPDMFIGGCGSQIYTFDEKMNAIADETWIKRLQKDWHKPTAKQAILSSRDLIDKYGKLEEKRESRTNDYMFSLSIADKGFDLNEVKRDFARVLEQQTPLKVQIIGASVAYHTGSTVTRSDGDAGNRIFLDVLPKAAGKGPALAYVGEKMGLSMEQTIVAGDSGNDVSMFTYVHRSGKGSIGGSSGGRTVGAGIMVGNAREELRAVRTKDHVLARRRHAGGIVEGLMTLGAIVRKGTLRS